jgi:hypothetical protein
MIFRLNFILLEDKNQQVQSLLFNENSGDMIGWNLKDFIGQKIN